MRKAMQLKSRIKNLALKNKIPAQAVLQNFMLERLLERISVSKYKDIFILKGGMRIEIWAYNIETILAEKVETILRRSVLNTRPRDFYDVYILMKTHHRMIDKELFTAALNATARKRASLAALQEQRKILQAIQSDSPMRQRWDLYCRNNFYANNIKFDEVIKSLEEILN